MNQTANLLGGVPGSCATPTGRRDLVCPAGVNVGIEAKKQFPELSSPRSPHSLVAPASNAERERLARNLAEAIDDLYAMTLQLVTASAYLISCRCKSKAFWQLSERQRNEEGH